MHDHDTITPPGLSDPASTAREITRFVADVVDGAGADGVVVCLSGGLDSTVSATLAVDALGSDSVYGLLLPADANDRSNVDDARRVAEELVIDHRVVDVQPLLDQTVRTLTMEVRESDRHVSSGSSTRRVTVDPVPERRNYGDAVGNAAARLRMLAAYFEANTTDRLVLGTGNRSERLLGYVTKYGDGGADLLPIGHLYKSEVRDLAEHLDVPERILSKPPTAGLRAGQTDAADLGAPYPVIDAVLRACVDEGRPPDEAAASLGVDRGTVARLLDRHERTAHKRALPPTPATHDPA